MPRGEVPPRHRRPQPVSRVHDRARGRGGRRRGDPHRKRLPLHGLEPRRPRLPGGRWLHPRQLGPAGRPCVARGPCHPGRALRRAPVHPHRPLRLRGRRLGDRAGRRSLLHVRAIAPRSSASTRSGSHAMASTTLDRPGEGGPPDRLPPGTSARGGLRGASGAFRLGARMCRSSPSSRGWGSAGSCGERRGGEPAAHHRPHRRRRAIPDPLRGERAPGGAPGGGGSPGEPGLARARGAGRRLHLGEAGPVREGGRRAARRRGDLRGDAGESRQGPLLPRCLARRRRSSGGGAGGGAQRRQPPAGRGRMARRAGPAGGGDPTPFSPTGSQRRASSASARRARRSGPTPATGSSWRGASAHWTSGRRWS